jgi:hypothetical protein
MRESRTMRTVGQDIYQRLWICCANAIAGINPAPLFPDSTQLLVRPGLMRVQAVCRASIPGFSTLAVRCRSGKGLAPLRAHYKLAPWEASE